MDPVLQLIGLANKAGRLSIGDEPVGAAARARQARLLLIASDATENTVRRMSHFSESGNVLSLALPFTKAELGATVGRMSCAMLAITDAGFAASLVKKLALRDPETYTAAAEQLSTKAEKVLKRQKEQLAHEKNVKTGKKRPWAPPVPASSAASTVNPTGTNEERRAFQDVKKRQ